MATTIPQFVTSQRYGGASPARRRCLAAGALVTLAAGLAGCVGSVDTISAAYVDPGKFTFYRCDDLNRHAQLLVSRERQLRDNMTKAEQSPGGALASAMAYRADYLSVRGEMTLLEKAAVEKKCDLRQPQPVDNPIR